MSDFNSWDEVKEYLLEGKYNSVTYHVWTFSRGAYVCCDPDCDCGHNFDDIEDLEKD